MTGIDFDRQAFIPSTDPPKRAASPQFLGLAVLLVAAGAVALMGFKLFSDNSKAAESAADKQRIEELQGQLADMQKRMEQMEKHRKVTVPDPKPNAVKPAAVPEKSVPARREYQITAASALSPRSAAPKPQAQPVSARPPVAATQNASAADLTADREAWQATTNRLADVVGVVGTQQGQIAENREKLNELLAGTRRKALAFELRKGETPQAIGPVSLQLKDLTRKSQRYSVCVYVDQKCVELKDRSLREVVVFVAGSGGHPLELVATKIFRDGIAGYLEVPLEE